MLSSLCDCQKLAVLMDQNPNLPGKRDFATVTTFTFNYFYIVFFAISEVLWNQSYSANALYRHGFIREVAQFCIPQSLSSLACRYLCKCIVKITVCPSVVQCSMPLYRGSKKLPVEQDCLSCSSEFYANFDNQTI